MNYTINSLKSEAAKHGATVEVGDWFMGIRPIEIWLPEGYLWNDNDSNFMKLDQYKDWPAALSGDISDAINRMSAGVREMTPKEKSEL